MTRTLLTPGEQWTVIQADSLQLLREIPDASLDAVVTDPPYGISFQQQAWDGRAIHDAALQATSAETRLSQPQAFERWTELWGAECLRALKPGGHLAAFAAPRMSHRLISGLENAGLEIRDVLLWLYGQGMPKSRRLPGGRATALKPAYEPIVLTRRPPTGPVADTIATHGTGALNTVACEIPNDDGGQPRWPANVVASHQSDCHDDVCAPGCAVAALDAPHQPGTGPSRFLYCAKASRRERDAGCDQLPARQRDLFPNTTRRAQVVRNAHPTVKPIELMRWLIRLVTPEDGVALDPFCGSGTTGIAAILEQRRFIGVELEAEHAEIARARITHYASNPTAGEQLDRSCQGRARRRPQTAGARDNGRPT
jgi:DNA modification methylase